MHEVEVHRIRSFQKIAIKFILLGIFVIITRVEAVLQNQASHYKYIHTYVCEWFFLYVNIQLNKLHNTSLAKKVCKNSVPVYPPTNLSIYILWYDKCSN